MFLLGNNILNFGEVDKGNFATVEFVWYIKSVHNEITDLNVLNDLNRLNYLLNFELASRFKLTPDSAAWTARLR